MQMEGITIDKLISDVLLVMVSLTHDFICWQRSLNLTKQQDMSMS